ncbi:MAG TPA: glutamyl-tRNA amidotransferase, partial [Bacteroidetes bacterium]|nr:glutamyl-tRNA amidotransferase [Bacteroidota bacterium]
IENILKETGFTEQKDFGKLMGEVMKQLKGKIDGKVIQELVRKRMN